MKVENNNYKFAGKWSPEIGQYGFTQIPNLLFNCQGHLNLEDGELATLLQLLMFWFHHESRVYPSIATLAKASDKGYSTIQKRLKILEDKGFIKRHRKLGSSNTYDLTPCVACLYKHQKTCRGLPRRRSTLGAKTRHELTSYSDTKEYEAKRRNGKNRPTPVSDLLQTRYRIKYD